MNKYAGKTDKQANEFQEDDEENKKSSAFNKKN
jgi:hypothetical protein